MSSMETIATPTSAGSFIVGNERNMGTGIGRVELHLALEVGERDTETLRQLLDTMLSTADGPFAGGSADARTRVNALISELAEQQESLKAP